MASEFKLEEIMWAAGFYEGEGTVGLRMAKIAQQNLWPLERLKTSFGGNIYRKGKDGCYQWTICGYAGRDFIMAIYPHLSPPRQSQIDNTFTTWAKWYGRREIRRKSIKLTLLKTERDPKTGRMRRIQLQ